MYYAVRFVATSAAAHKRADITIPVLFKRDITRLHIDKIAREQLKELFGNVPYVLVGRWQIKSLFPIEKRAEIEFRM